MYPSAIPFTVVKRRGFIYWHFQRPVFVRVVILLDCTSCAKFFSIKVVPCLRIMKPLSSLPLMAGALGVSPFNPDKTARVESNLSTSSSDKQWMIFLRVSPTLIWGGEEVTWPAAPDWNVKPYVQKETAVRQPVEVLKLIHRTYVFSNRCPSYSEPWCDIIGCWYI